MAFGDTLKELRLKSGLTQEDVAKGTGLSKSSISMYELGNRKPSFEVLEAIADFFNVDMNTLTPTKALTATGVFLGGVAASNTKGVITSNKSISTKGSRDIGIDGLLEAPPHSNLPCFEYQFVPYGVSAGDLEEVEAIKELPRVSVPDFMLGRYARNPNILLMPVNGDSMNNIIKNGAIIAVLRNVEPTSVDDGAIVVIQNCGDYAVKRFFNDKPHQEYVFRPDSSNPSFREIRFSYENCDDLQLVGKVVMYNVTL